MDQAFQISYQTSMTLADVLGMDRVWRLGMLDRIIEQRKQEANRVKSDHAEAAKQARQRRMRRR